MFILLVNVMYAIGKPSHVFTNPYMTCLGSNATMSTTLHCMPSPFYASLLSKIVLLYNTKDTDSRGHLICWKITVNRILLVTSMPNTVLMKFLE